MLLGYLSASPAAAFLVPGPQCVAACQCLATAPALFNFTQRRPCSANGSIDCFQISLAINFLDNGCCQEGNIPQVCAGVTASDCQCNATVTFATNPACAAAGGQCCFSANPDFCVKFDIFNTGAPVAVGCTDTASGVTAVDAPTTWMASCEGGANTIDDRAIEMDCKATDPFTGAPVPILHANLSMSCTKCPQQ